MNPGSLQSRSSRGPSADVFPDHVPFGSDLPDLPDEKGNSLPELLAFVADLVARGGPRAAEFAGLDRMMNLLPMLAPSELAQLRAAFGDSLRDLETMQAFAYLKPRGYAGDFEIIDRIYCERVTANNSLAAWDHYFHAQPATRAVRNRKVYFQELLDRHAAAKRPLRVLNLASGPGRCMAEWLWANPTAEVEFTCVELDAAAIAHARSLLDDGETRVTFVQQNILRFTPAGSYDLVWAAGVCDYFTEALVVRLMRRLLPAIAPGGELVIGNFSDANPSRPYMEILGEWRLFHRSELGLRRIAEAAGAAPATVSIGAEPEAVNLFLHVAGSSA